MNYRVAWHRVATAVACALPQRLAYSAARGAGSTLAILPSHRRTALRANIAAAHQTDIHDPRVRRDIDRAFQHAMLNYVDLFRMARHDMPEFVDRIAVVDWRPFDAAKNKGNGVILVSAHLGNFDSVVQKLALRGIPCMIPVQPVEPPELLNAVVWQRSMMGLEIVPVGPSTFRMMAAKLRSGGAVVVASDRDVQGSGYRTELFGRAVQLPQAAIVLALRTGAPILGAFGYRRADNTIVGRFSTELPVERLSSAGIRHGFKFALEVGMKQLAAMLEREIAKDPGQWVVQQPLFDDISPAQYVSRAMTVGDADGAESTGGTLRGRPHAAAAVSLR